MINNTVFFRNITSGFVFFKAYIAIPRCKRKLSLTITEIKKIHYLKILIFQYLFTQQGKFVLIRGLRLVCFLIKFSTSLTNGAFKFKLIVKNIC